MANNELPRRDFLWLASTAPFALAWGCRAESAGATTAEAALGMLILAVGPWTADDREDAERFATNFTQSRKMSAPFLAEASTMQSLLRRAQLQRKPMALPSLDLTACSPAERDLLQALVKRIYGLVAVRDHIAGIPSIGSSAGRVQYTRAPSEWSAPYRRPK